MTARTPLPKWPTLNLEREFDGRVCGIDEAGYAPIAGPVVAAAVVLPARTKPRQLRGLTDSKLLTAAQRQRFEAIILRLAETGVGMASVEEIDRLNIYRANLLAMQRAVAALGLPPDAAIVDGRAAPSLACTVRTAVKGDRRSLTVAAASVIAKEARDRLMRQLAGDHPGYGWDTNVGYGTDEHYLGLLRHGPTRHHRRSFAPLTTLFAAGGAGIGRYRFVALERMADPRRPELLELRRDLYAVFDADGCHIGQVKNLRGRWTFQSTGYGADAAPLPGQGPCAVCHGAPLDAPAPALVAELLAARLG